MSIQKKVEEYIDVIYGLINEKKQARVSDVAEKLGIRPASVTEMIQKLHKDGLVIYERYGPIKLTEKGTSLAKNLSQRHDILKAFLQLLGVSEEIAERDACEIEHNVSPKTVKRLTSFIEFIQRAPESQEWLNNFKSFHEKRNPTSEEIKKDAHKKI